MSENREIELKKWHADMDRRARARADKKQPRGMVRVEVYRVDAILLRKTWTPKCAGTVTKRGTIGNVPSSRSLRNLVFVLNNSDIQMRSMLTLTMTPLCHKLCPPHVHRYAMKLCLQRLRDKGIKDYVWVREFQKNGSVHWHIFTSKQVGAPGEVNEELSHEWRNWWTDVYWKRIISPSKVPEIRKKHKISEWHMRNGNGMDFGGSCRFEELKTEAAGRYAAKEGAKRFQKLAPVEWLDEGGAWWRASKTIKCTPISEEWIKSDRLETTTMTIKDRTEEIAYKLQQNLGLKILSEKKDVIKSGPVHRNRIPPSFDDGPQ